MADGVASPTLTKTVTECWVYATTSGTVYSTPAEPVATGAECYVIFPTGGGVEYSPIPNSDVPFTSLPPPTSTSSSSTHAVSSNIVGPIVGSVVGILVMTVPIMWYLTYRQRKRRRELEKRQWAMKPGKWSFPGKPETLPMDTDSDLPSA